MTLETAFERDIVPGDALLARARFQTIGLATRALATEFGARLLEYSRKVWLPWL